LVVALSGCWSLPISLNMADDGSVQAVDVGDVVRIRLPGNAATGHQWSRVEPTSFGDGPLEIIDEEVFSPDDPNLCGGPGVFTYRYRAVAAGTVTLSFVYRLAWEDEILDEYSVIVWVK